MDDKLVYRNVYEALAGEQGFVFYTTDTACECGSGLPNMGFLAGSVEMDHDAHPVKVSFDDDSYVVVECPKMHFGPYHVHTPPQTPLEELHSAVEEFHEAAAALKDAVDAKAGSES